MPGTFTDIGPFTFRTYPLALGLAFVAAVGLGAWRTRTLAPVVDACIVGLVGAILGARAQHVALNWDYFQDHLNEIHRLRTGGLNWHGALIVGLPLLWLGARLRRVDLRALLPALTPLPALVALAGWYACWSAGCAYGMEVDTLARYPAVAVAETRDIYGIIAPRYNTQLLGVLLSLALTVVAGLLVWRFPKWRGGFWLMLTLAALTVFGVGFVRGDFSPIVAGLRFDQWLDLGVAALGLVGLILAAIRENRKTTRAFQVGATD